MERMAQRAKKVSREGEGSMEIMERMYIQKKGK